MEETFVDTEVARSIGSFLDAIGLERTAIVGHSWGGGFALRFGELHPDRVTRLALIASGGLDVRDAWEFRMARLPIVEAHVLSGGGHSLHDDCPDRTQALLLSFLATEHA
ncbi:pimeloyl-ACP methyl ester carboxylesterase [Actinomadura cellulosilytica]|uniref:Pimeloyl-ACP methyl ester carboxylesterase n=1 Tax=Thermomonospora cellulosilytica TaxID=1411118 RepID=A0A7W3R7L7_9ACTN|nr:pimeloyl-ACP methyl ester carboxylesterase [Thermomonospora cellulosilytica]